MLYAFDLGDTLVEYEGLPLSWEAHYPAALSALAQYCSLCCDPAFEQHAISVLKRYNTRLTPRLAEVSFHTLLAAMIGDRALPSPCDALGCARAFFGPFRQRLRCMDETIPTLRAIRAGGARVAVFTDVPYGMPRELVEEDVRESRLAAEIDFLATSGDVGFRKPDPRTLRHLMERLGVEPATTVYVGNEKKDVEVALACGCQAILVDRHGQHPQWGQHRTIGSLADLAT